MICGRNFANLIVDVYLILEGFQRFFHYRFTWRPGTGVLNLQSSRTAKQRVLWSYDLITSIVRLGPYVYGMNLKS